MKTIFKTAYGERYDKAVIDGANMPSLTEQNHKPECDINNILSKFQMTGIVTHQNKHSPHYADIPSTDFAEAMEIVAKAKSMFEELPSKARSQFENNPEKFLEFIQNPDNQQAAFDMGLSTTPPKPPETTPKQESGKVEGSPSASPDSAGASIEAAAGTNEGS